VSLDTNIIAEDAPKATPAPTESSLPAAQTDGATAEQAGSSTLHEPEYDVQVKLADMQADPNNPLFSAKTFEQLGLYA
jgi:ATP-dependent RNA helicase DDX19/DBP5